MGWLKKIGIILAKAQQVVTGIDPFLPFINPKAAAIADKAQDKIGELASIIVTVEAIGAAVGMAGPDKLKAAAPLVAQSILQSAAFAGKEIDDDARFQAGVEQIANGMVDVLNAIKADD